MGTAIGCVFAALAPLGAAQAQSASASRDDLSELTEVVVTAQKRSERLVDVPAAISAIGGPLIEATGAERLSDLQNNVPNLAIESDNAFTATVRVRGVGDYSRNIGYDTRVGVYLDGIYLGQSPSLDQELVELERVEVLRGPQGALFGKNTVAGAINLIAKRPTDEFEGYVAARVGNLDARQFTGRLNLPLGDKAALRLSINKSDRDGYVKNLVSPDRRIADRDSLSYSAQLKADLSDQITVLAVLDGLRKREIGDYGDPLTDSLGVLADVDAPRAYEESKNRTDGENVDVVGGAVTVDFDLGDAGLIRSISSYRRTEFRTQFDTDHTKLDIHYVDFQDDYKQKTQELQFVSPGGRKFEYLVGLYYYEQDSSTYRRAIPGAAGGFLGPIVPVVGKVETKNIALFANATYDLASNLELGLGFRLSREKKVTDWSINGGAGTFATGAFSGSRVDNDFSPTATLTYSLRDDLKLYARYSEGYKSGGYNIDFVSQVVFPKNVEFGKESVRNYEVGAKGSLFDRRLRLAVTAFWAEYANYQVNQLIDLGGGRSDFVIGNVAARTRGVELEATALLTPSLTLSGSLGLLDPTYGRFPGGGAAGGDVTGNRLSYASKVQGALGVDYVRDLASALKLKAHIDYAYRGNYYTTVDNVRVQPLLSGVGSVPFGYVKSYDTVNARVAVGDESGRWEVAIWSRNLTDSHHIENSRREFFGSVLQYYAEPRTYGLEAKVKF